jgi:hypothetical protein
VNGFERITPLAPFTHVELRNSGPTEVVLAAHLDASSAARVVGVGSPAALAETAAEVGGQHAFGPGARLVRAESSTSLTEAASDGSVWTAAACGSLPAHGRQRWVVRILDERGVLLARSDVELTCIGPAIAANLAVPELEYLSQRCDLPICY